LASAIWLTDRSRYETGTSRCAEQRYLRYHAGPTGYGYAPKSESVPLTTGKFTHQGLDPLARILKAYDRMPTPQEVRGIIRDIMAEYDADLTAKGFRGGMFTGPVIEETIKEQRTLISGLIWALQIHLLPWVHQQYQILEVETERLHFLDCQCGAGPLPQAQHDARGCQGKALMLRTDILAQHRIGRHLAYFEGKTTGWESDAFAEQWEIKPQLGLGTLDLDTRYGAEVSELFIIGMNKGSRKKDDKDFDTPLAGMKRQQSALCYGYMRPGNPPLAKDDWAPSYTWINAAGEKKTVSKAHKRRGVWVLGESDWSLWSAYHASDPEMPAEEFWVHQLPLSVRDKICFVLGPMNRQDQQLRDIRENMQGEEERWQQILWELYTLQQRGFGWASPEFQSRKNQLIPKSWNCRPFGREHECEFIHLCYKHAGWEDPMNLGKYVPRRPHHAPELEQAVARGLLAAEAADVEEEG
jgi:hypothetical protein